MIASSRISVTAPAPCSSFKTAKTAEESNTALAILLLARDFSAPIFDQLVNKAHAFGNKFPKHGLRAADSGRNCQKPQFALVNRRDQRVTFLQSERLAECGRNYDAAVRTEFH